MQIRREKIKTDKERINVDGVKFVQHEQYICLRP